VTISDGSLTNFYKKLETFFETEETSLQDSAKLVVLFRLALEVGGRELGLNELNYLLARIQYTAVGISLGKDVSFEGIVDEFVRAGEKASKLPH
jgi:hypothetical protein|tara:strand:- start:209 stop:490 length:282 start_codon:yes stop_codon:yes gene_type:complete